MLVRICIALPVCILRDYHHIPVELQKLSPCIVGQFAGPIAKPGAAGRERSHVSEIRNVEPEAGRVVIFYLHIKPGTPFFLIPVIPIELVAFIQGFGYHIHFGGGQKRLLMFGGKIGDVRQNGGRIIPPVLACFFERCYFHAC